ncbi:hypothetical protein [Pseudomonas sp. UMAB-40]|uniref:hypothetical protein n=1 Tax=Pseudomonas sp. UMAB-40 TaxID=1365407 RepID=UPI001C55C52E|nr:hypothetical protein [Pseudomonas sp. UMAB-40]
MAPNKPLTFNAPEVKGVDDPDVDPEGYIPLPLLLTGIDVIVPLWDEPAMEPGERDILTVRFEQPGQLPVAIENIYTPADMKPEFVIHIGPEHLVNNGVGELWYEVLDTADNPSFSFRRKLTIDHTPIPMDLEEAGFLYRNNDGYYNCDTDPPIWSGIHVVIPPLTLFQIGDRCKVIWRGYSSLNASGVQFVRARWINVRTALSDKDIREGYPLVVEPYDIHIAPMVKNSSATLVYQIYRGARLVGVSKTALVKIDRIRSGEELPCGP